MKPIIFFKKINFLILYNIDNIIHFFKLFFFKFDITDYSNKII